MKNNKFIGYTSIFQPEVKRSLDKKGKGGVECYIKEKAYNGYTLFCRIGGNHFYLIDMQGKVIHRWEVKHASIQFGRLTDRGTLLFSTHDRSVEENRGVHELDWNGKEIWYHRCAVDHDFYRLDNGNTLILCREESIEPEIRNIWPDYVAVYSPFVLEVNPQEEVVWEWHGKEHIKELNELVDLPLTPQESDETRDWAHCNNCFPLPKNRLGASDSRFSEGNILFSYRTLDTIGIVDKKTKKIVWAWGPGEIVGQHNPIMVEDGNLFIFDNGTHSAARRRTYSRIVELDPASREIVWEYKGCPPESFCSGYVSGQQVLPNGNVLICSGGQGMIFEVTKDKEIVWKYINPYRDKSGTNALYRHSGRYSPEFVESIAKHI